MNHTWIIALFAAVLIIAATIVIYIKSENKKFRVTNYIIKNNKLPRGFKGTKIAFLTDLHSWEYGVENEPLIAAVDEANPDYVLIGGDMFVKGPEFDPTNAIHLIMELVTKYPVFYAFGNHELRVSRLMETKDTTFVEYIETLKEIGVTFLVDNEVILQRENEKLRIVGLNLGEEHFEKFSKNKVTQKVLCNHIGECKKEDFTILLAHNPRYFKEYSEWGADFVLSGHVHGGMIVLPFVGGVISTQGLLFPKYDFGEFKEDNSTMVVSRGLGNHTINIRFNNRAELSVITLE